MTKTSTFMLSITLGILALLGQYAGQELFAVLFAIGSAAAYWLWSSKCKRDDTFIAQARQEKEAASASLLPISPTKRESRRLFVPPPLS